MNRAELDSLSQRRERRLPRPLIVFIPMVATVALGLIHLIDANRPHKHIKSKEPKGKLPVMQVLRQPTSFNPSYPSLIEGRRDRNR